MGAPAEFVVRAVLIIGKEMPQFVAHIKKKLRGNHRIDDDALAPAGDQAMQTVTLALEGLGCVENNLESQFGRFRRIDIIQDPAIAILNGHPLPINIFITGLDVTSECFEGRPIGVGTKGGRMDDRPLDDVRVFFKKTIQLSALGSAATAERSTQATVSSSIFPSDSRYS